MKLCGLIEDVLIILDVIFTFVALTFKNMGNQTLCDLFFGISGAALMLALVFLIIKRVMKARAS